MKIKSVILDTNLLKKPNPALWSHAGVSLLDWQIQNVLRHNRNPILILGQDGDEILRFCKGIEHCDLVYNSDPVSNSGLIAGLHGSGTCAFYLPIDVAYPDEEVWLTLEKSFIQLAYNNKIALIKPVHEGHGYPWVITNYGKDFLLKNPQTSLQDLSLQEVSVYHQSVIKILNDPKDLKDL